MIKKYLQYTRTSKMDAVKEVYIEQKGLFNSNGKRWSKIKAKQWINIPKQEFVWKAKVGPIAVVDQFVDKKGSLQISLWGLFDLAKMTGPELDQGEALRFLSEMIWYPSAFLEDYLSWEKESKDKATAIMKIGNKEVKATFFFNEDGSIYKITAKRYREIKGKFELNDWEISNISYAQFGAYTLPNKAQVLWKLPDEDLCYYQLEVTDILFDRPR